MKYGTRDISPEDTDPVQASMPPPPVAMTASKLRIQTLEEQLKQKNRIIHALETQKRSHLAYTAEKAKQRELAKMNSGWRKHNANPNTPHLYRSEAITKDEEGKIKIEKVIFVTEYKLAMEKIKKMNAEAELAETRAKMLRVEQKDVYRKTQELIKVAEELEVKVARETRMRIAKSSPGDDQDTADTGGNTTDSDNDVNMRELSTPTAPNRVRLLLHPPKREGSLSIENVRPTRLRLSQPKRERSVSVEEILPIQWRLSQPKEKKFEESSVPVEAIRPIRWRLSQPRPETVGKDSERVRNGRIFKRSAKARK